MLGQREGAASAAGGRWESSYPGSQETLAGQVSWGLRTSYGIEQWGCHWGSQQEHFRGLCLSQESEGWPQRPEWHGFM